MICGLPRDEVIAEVLHNHATESRIRLAARHSVSAQVQYPTTLLGNCGHPRSGTGIDVECP